MFIQQVVNLQRRKQELADLTLDGGPVSKAQLTYGRLQVCPCATLISL
jgi:hypothetical protein